LSGRTLDIRCQITTFDFLVESVAVIARRVVVRALIAAQIVVFTAWSVLVNVVAVDFLRALGRESAQWRVIEITWKFAVLSDAAFNHLVRFALLGLSGEKFGIWTHKLSQLAIHALIIPATTCSYMIIKKVNLSKETRKKVFD
jgi:hypothetical protein